MSLELLYFLAYTSVFSIVLPLFIGIVKIRAFDFTLKVLIFYLAFCFVADLYCMYLSSSKTNNLFISYISSFIEFAAFTYVFFDFIHVKSKNLYWSIITLLFLGVVLLDMFYFGDYSEMSEIARNVESIVLIAFSVTWFYSLLHKPEIVNLVGSPAFWINTAVITYFSGNFFLFLFSNYLLHNDADSLSVLYAIHSILSIIFNLLIAVAFLNKKRAG